jgi:hypothetical protein
MSLTTTQRFAGIAALATLLSVGGIVYAVCVTKSAQDGGRGGALAVALSFAVLFLSRGYGTRVYDILTKEAPEAIAELDKLTGKSGNRVITADEKIDALVSKTRIDAQVQESQNIFLAASSAIGTIAWGFGDMVAQYFIGVPAAIPCLGCAS